VVFGLLREPIPAVLVSFGGLLVNSLLPAVIASAEGTGGSGGPKIPPVPPLPVLFFLSSFLAARLTIDGGTSNTVKPSTDAGAGDAGAPGASW
jgi:hypothetical protein